MIWVGQTLTEQIGQIRKSVAGMKQEIIAPVVWIGSGQVNVAQLMLDTLDVVKQLAEQLAGHTHPDTGQPTNSADIAATGSWADTLTAEYSPIIGQ